MEKVERRFEKEVAKEMKERNIRKADRDRKKKEKENFVKKFFPNSNNSPGGTLRLVNSISSREGGVGKIDRVDTPSNFKRKRFDIHPISSIFKREKSSLNIQKSDSEKPVIRIFGGTVPVVECGRPGLTSGDQAKEYV